MPGNEQRQRMRALREIVKAANVYRWAASMLLDAEALRAPAPLLARRASAGAGVANGLASV